MKLWLMTHTRRRAPRPFSKGGKTKAPKPHRVPMHYANATRFRFAGALAGSFCCVECWAGAVGPAASGLRAAFRALSLSFFARRFCALTAAFACF